MPSSSAALLATTTADCWAGAWAIARADHSPSTATTTIDARRQPLLVNADFICMVVGNVQASQRIHGKRRRPPERTRTGFGLRERSDESRRRPPRREHEQRG